MGRALTRTKTSIEVVRADCFESTDFLNGHVDLVCTDPPYGGILDKGWDVECYTRLGKLIDALLVPGGTAYVWGGIGKNKSRPFLKWLSEVETTTSLRLHNLITWAKRRAYGKPDNYLFTREECALFVKGNRPNTFNVPYLSVLRGYVGYNPKYPAKSAYLRRTNVWTEITEIFRGKIHPAEKPSKLAEIMIRTSSASGDLVVDLFAGSGSTGVAAIAVGDRRCVLIERSGCVMHSFCNDDAAHRRMK